MSMFDETYEARLEARLRYEDVRRQQIATLRKREARLIADDFDGTEVLPSYCEATG